MFIQASIFPHKLIDVTIINVNLRILPAADWSRQYQNLGRILHRWLAFRAIFITTQEQTFTLHREINR
jgi:hypothetical protein